MIGSVTAVDLQNNDSFNGIKDIYHSAGRTHRTASEAFKDAEYACAITKFDDDLQATFKWLSGVAINISGSAFLGGVFVGLIYWLTR
jgi:hypothetical protein